MFILDFLMLWAYTIVFCALLFFIGTSLTDCFGLFTGMVGIGVFVLFILSFGIYMGTDGFNIPL